jgi:Domain of unknown function (DUF4190)/DUF1707 SHOCT-like domain
MDRQREALMTNWPQYGYQLAAQGQAGLRASDADRDRACEVLKTGFAEGRLAKDEYDALLEQVYSARTLGELARATGQLPGGGAALYPPAPARPRTNPLAQAALACGVAEFFTFGLTCIPAVVLGHMARGQIRRTGEAGSTLALTGLVLGWIGVIMWLLFWVVVLGAGLAIGFHGGPVHRMPGPNG